MNVLNVLVSALAGCTAVDGSPIDTHGMYGLGETHYYEVRPETTQQQYFVYVRLPEGYAESPQALYPAVYILDGGLLYPLLSAYYRYLNLAEDVPDTIIVGISYGTEDWRAGNSRSRDYTAPSAERDFWDHPPWALETVTLEGHNHFSAAPAAFRKGMIWQFATGE